MHCLRSFGARGGEIPYAKRGYDKYGPRMPGRWARTLGSTRRRMRLACKTNPFFPREGSALFAQPAHFPKPGTIKPWQNEPILPVGRRPGLAKRTHFPEAGSVKALQNEAISAGGGVGFGAAPLAATIAVAMPCGDTAAGGYFTIEQTCPAGRDISTLADGRSPSRSCVLFASVPVRLSSRPVSTSVRPYSSAARQSNSTFRSAGMNSTVALIRPRLARRSRTHRPLACGPTSDRR